MERVYSDGVRKVNPRFFTGKEVEHTGAYGMDTLFCRGDLNIREILDQLILVKVDHVYLNHNHTQCIYLDHKIRALLKLGYYVTYEALTPQDVSHIRDPRLFHLVSIPIPYVGDTVYLKIDDIGFDKTNPGVWVTNTERSAEFFTPWSEYQNDEVL